MGVGVQRPAQGTEQRRSRRHRIELPVEIVEGQRRRTVHTIDVSRHGLFIATEDPPRERFLLQLSIMLPTGVLPATAFVARRVKDGAGKPSGIGVQFFALSAQSKERWDAFVFDLSGMAPPPSTGDLAQRKPDVATFLIKLRDRTRLLEFYEKNIARNGLYMATPVIKETGAEVGLVVIHPETEQEYFLTGTVQRVCTDAPKGMEIELALTPERKKHFHEFVTTGIGPEVLETVPVHRAEIEKLPLATQKPESEDISIDIVVDEELIEESEQFLWTDVSETSGVLTFDISVHEQRLSEADTDDLRDEREQETDEIDISPPPRRASTRDLLLDLAREPSRDLAPRPARERGGTVVPRNTAVLYEMPAAPLSLSVSCSGCGIDYGTVELGGLGAPLGLLASRHPYWCKYEDQIVSVVRLSSGEERRMMLQHLGDDARHQPVTLELAFAIAELSEGPRCPSCGGDVRSDGIPRAVAQSLDEIRGGATVKLENVRCPSCREPELVAGPATGDQ